MQQIYKKYKDRFIEISGKSRALFTRSIIKKYSFDLGSVLPFHDIDTFYSFLWKKTDSFSLINEKIMKKISKAVSSSVYPDDVSPLDVNKVVSDLKYLKREVEEIQKETGKYDLYIGFPYVFGKINDDISVKAPLLLFPVSLTVEKDFAMLTHIENQPIIFNRSFILAYCNENKIKTDNLISEFDPLSESTFSSIQDVISYLEKNNFKFSHQKRKTVVPFDPIREFEQKGLEIKYMAVLGRFPLANPIYNDYEILEKQNLSTPSIDLLLQGKAKKEKKIKNTPITYTINDLDYAQENAIDQINRSSNIVIYGPPGTGKSQTIVNIISDALCKNKKVLVVSQKRAALDVVFSRLGKLNSKAMFIPDPEKDKAAFFDRIRLLHAQALREDFRATQKKFQNNEASINKEVDILENISKVLFSPTEFGLSLQEMYAQSYNIGKDSKDYRLYEKLLDTPISKMNYQELYDVIRYVSDKKLSDLYIDRQKALKNNPLIAHLKTDIELHQLKEVSFFVGQIIDNEMPPFDFSQYPHSRYLATFYLEKTATKRPEMTELANIIMQVENKSLCSWLKASYIPPLWIIFPFTKYAHSKKRDNIVIDLNIALKALEMFEKPFALLQSILDDEGYALVMGGIINGNKTFVKSLQKALENYVAVRDMNIAISELSDTMKTILEFSYENSDKTYAGVNETLNKIIPLRIYHEIIKNGSYIENTLSKTVGFDSIRERIIKLKIDQRELTKSLALDKFSQDYLEYYEHSEKSKDYLYQIQKQRALWPIRRMVEFFSDFLFRLFPCWLLSPQAVSTIFPLEKDMFDLVVFDEASQMFVENALPTIYRGSRIVVAGDNKQLRPSSGFVRRYQADDTFDYSVDLSTQAALEVESLLDLATSKFTPVHLTYHYRSMYSELIDFSNVAFYDNKLQIAPNILKSNAYRPIERIKVRGMWQNRHNHEEAVAVVKLVRTLLRERKYNESIGIVTFNNEQKEYIEDMLDAEADKVAVFRKQLYAEQNRIENGENSSLFVKNLENVQGDERDIIIFSIGYAKNDADRVVAQFGSLSMDGGENRLNVAITRAKKKVYVVTSIEPEELDNVETTKNSGPKLLRKYLIYARAVSGGSESDIKTVLSTFSHEKKNVIQVGAYEEKIKQGLEQLGYTVFTNLGNTSYKLSLGVYDKELQRFILGIECDYSAYKSSESVLERDVYRIKFLESRGWKIVRVWSRDWWQSPKQVLNNLSEIIEREKEKLLAERDAI